MLTVKRTERGWAGHYILADECKFRRNTLLEYANKKWVVSTVGNCWIDNHLKQIGYNRYYETMAFVAKDDEYKDADVLQPINIDSTSGLYASTSDEFIAKHPFPDNDANKMHEKVVEELTAKIKCREGIDNA